VISGVGAFVFCILNTYISWRTIKGHSRDAWIRTLAVASAAWGGTSFRGVTLTNVNFTNACLKNCDFRKSRIMYTDFKDTHKLELSRLGQTLLANTAVRNLLTKTDSGYMLDLQKADLRWAFLRGMNLEKANLKQADLSKSAPYFCWSRF